MGDLTNFIAIMAGIALVSVALAYGVHLLKEKHRKEFTDPKVERHYHYGRNKSKGEGFNEKNKRSKQHHSHKRRKSKSHTGEGL